MSRWALSLCLCLGVGCSAPAADDFAAGEAAYQKRDYRAARGHYEAALAEAAGPAPQVRARLGLTLRKLGDPAAVAVLEQAIAEAESVADGHTAARARRYLGRALDDRGEHDRAMALYDDARAWHEAHGPLDDLLRVQMMRAGSAWRTRRFDPAFAAYQDVHDRAVVAGQVDVQAGGLEGMALLLGYAGQFADAREALGQAQALYRTVGRTDALANALANEAAFALNQGDLDGARTRAELALALARESGLAITGAQAEIVRGWVQLERGEWAAARAAANAAEQVATTAELAPLQAEARLLALKAAVGAHDTAAYQRRLEQLAGVELHPDVALPLLAVKARVALAAGRKPAAITALDQAIAGYEANRAELHLDLSRFFTTERVWAYETRVRLAAEAGDLATLTRLIGQVKARTFSELLRAGPADPHRRAERAQHLLALRRRPAPPPGPLPADLDVLEFYTLPEHLVLIWRSGPAHAVELVPAARGDVDVQVRRLIDAVRAGADARAASAWLSARLLAPLTDAIAASGNKRLAVIPHGPLHPVPFEMLPWSGGLLVDRYRVFSAPSLGALSALLARPAPPPPTASLAVGDPLEDLPGARREVQSLAARHGGPQLVGPQATEGAVRGALARGAPGRLVHFAVHGVRPADDAPAYLQLNADAAHDGHLQAHEIAAGQVEARLVVLSVCNSARGRANRGDEVVGVLDRAFLEAGARAVVASRWPVHDAASVLFTQALYARLETQPLLEAFHGAQLALRTGQVKPSDLGPALAQLDLNRERGVRERRDRSTEDFTHPYYWASFSLRGDPR